MAKKKKKPTITTLKIHCAHQWRAVGPGKERCRQCQIERTTLDVKEVQHGQKTKF